MTANADIENLLRQSIGLDAQSIGPSAVAAVVRLRMKRLGVDSVEEYFERVTASKAELHQLVEEIIVPETWFFRDRVAFATLARWVWEDWLPAHPRTTLRLLSAPCSTGEEAYSLAMCLLDAGLGADRFVVEAVDISSRSLERAAQGVFGKNAFRGADLEFRSRHFTPVPEGWRLHEDVRRLVQFRQGNLLEAEFAGSRAVQDVIFCRNLLIYFDEPAQRHLMTLLHGLLAPDGLLFAGHAESFIFRTFGFRPAGRETSFAVHPRGAAPPPVREPERRPPARRVSTVPPLPPAPQPTPRRAGPEAGAPPTGKASPALVPAAEDLLVTARRLADAGRVAEAVQKCQSHLAANGPSSAAFYLLALLNEAAGHSAEAADFYRKTLYLEPDHPEALWQLALLQERLGETASARQLQQRAQRVRERMPA
jgi:chemotaxis protein methyltransferase WspC